MPTQVVSVDLQSETGAIGQQTFSDLLIVARDPTETDPTYNLPMAFDSAAQVAAEFGADSDAHVASEWVAERADRWWVVMLDTESYDNEELGGVNESISEAQVENAPLKGDETSVEVEVDASTQEVISVTESPPAQPSAGQAAVNFDTGEITVGESTDGGGTEAGIVASYENLTWDTAEPELNAREFGLTMLADTRADRSYLGEAEHLRSWAASNDVGMVLAYENGGEYENDEAAMTASHDMGAYMTSGNILPVAHKSSNDVAAGISGRLATKEAWFNPYMDGGADYSFSMEQYRRSLIGSPGTPGTFEGGDAGGEGPANVLYTEGGVQILSNSLSTAGSDSNYQFFDVQRTESFIVSEVKDALRGLRLRRENVPFTRTGRTLIEAALRERLNQYVAPQGQALSSEEIQQLREQQESEDNGGSGDGTDTEAAFQIAQDQREVGNRGNVPLAALDIQVPRFDDLSPSDRANREWSGIQITATLAGSAHTFSVELAVQV